MPGPNLRSLRRRSKSIHLQFGTVAIQKRVAVVGAGISGLGVARGLRERGVSCTVFEASDRVGGVLRSGRRDGRLLEWGPQRLRLTPEIRRLVGELRLDDELLVASGGLPLYVVRDAALHAVPRTLAGLLRGSLLTPAARRRALLEPFTAGVRPSESVAAALRRKFGDEAYRLLLGPLFGGLYASDPANMRCADSLSRFLARSGAPRSLLLHAVRLASTGRAMPACTFREGVAALPAALARDLCGALRLETAVRTIVDDGPGWRLRIATRRSAADLTGDERFTDVVLAVPAAEAGALLEPAAPGAAARLRRLTYNRLAMVHLAAGGSPIRGLGYQVAFGEPLETRGVTFNDALFGRDGVVTAFLGGARNVRLPEWPDGRIAEVAEREFLQITGREATSIEVSRPSVPAYDASWEALDDLRLPPGIHLCAGYVERAGVGGRLAQAARLVRKLV